MTAAARASAAERMASNVIDAPLDDVIKQKRSFGNNRRGFRGRARGRGGGVTKLSTGKKFGVKNFGSGNGSVSDLRDKLAKREVGDLRQKISTPKTQPLQVKAVQSVPSNNKRQQTLQPAGRTRAMTTGGMSNKHTPHTLPFQLSREEMKKIQITVPGRNRPVESPPSRSGGNNNNTYRTPRSRDEPRPASRPIPPRSSGGEQFARRTLNNVFHYASNVRSRSPSPFGTALDEYRYHRESLAQYGGSGPPPISQYSRGLQTGTCLVISNLNSTVSKGDVIELCQAIGPLDVVRITGPGIAEVLFINKEDAMEAYKKYHHRNLDGQPMICKLQMASATSQYDNLRDPYPTSSSRYPSGGRRDGGYIDYDREDYLGHTDYGL